MLRGDEPRDSAGSGRFRGWESRTFTFRSDSVIALLDIHRLLPACTKSDRGDFPDQLCAECALLSAPVGQTPCPILGH
eukprot:3723167-Rhodomonas_salina.1